MSSFVIEGGYKLSGEITPQGAKNEALETGIGKHSVQGMSEFMQESIDFGESNDPQCPRYPGREQSYPAIS